MSQLEFDRTFPPTLSKRKQALTMADKVALCREFLNRWSVE